MRSGFISNLKAALVHDQSQQRKVLFGIYRGLLFDINLATQSQLFLGLWERETYDVIRYAMKRTQYFVDVGAGKGELTVLFGRVPEVARVVAIEPDPYECNRIRHNLSINGVKEKVSIFQKCVGTSAAEGHISLDQLDLPVGKLGFLKIDVDGAELDVLRSGQQLLRQGDVYLLVETHSSQLETDCIKFLSELGYACTVIKNAAWRRFVPEHRDCAHNRWFVAEKVTS